ncbi:MAG: hypothetical protein M1829_005667 [Trizodia sp. TS-e1964]|nr:MAG: hypothetical protein M1829_005667 [Trizodia sp. TS-e1964]
MVVRQAKISWLWRLVFFCVFLSIANPTVASYGDKLPEFQDCVESCKEVNCRLGNRVLPLYLRLLLWTCASECDYTCQHIITEQRLARSPPIPYAVVQYHGKWPFQRFMGMQEPFSVLFSLFNFLAHRHGLAKIQEKIPKTYPLRKYYVAFAYFGLVSWVCSMIFHTRDFDITEKADYFAAGASVLYGLYYTPIRIFRLDSTSSPTKGTLLRLWTILCLLLYAAHVAYLTLVRWDYTYNMAANVVVGIIQNTLWSWFSVTQYRKVGKWWAAWPGMIVAWLVLAMSLELLDFVPFGPGGGWIDAHSLWHLGTVVPAIWWYSYPERFLVKDALLDLERGRLKA